VTPLDHDRILALSYVPAPRRPAVKALWNLDRALAQVLSTGREPMISRIRLAWWREALEKLDREKPPAEPVLQALAAHVLPAGVAGAELAEMETGWSLLLDPDPMTAETLSDYARARGGRLFALSARLLGGDPGMAARGGERWALVDLARHSANRLDAEAAIDATREIVVIGRWPVPLRPLGMLAILAARDAEQDLGAMEEPGAPVRMLRMLRHRITGR
jgi:15-cis-phytoene synthase